MASALIGPAIGGISSLISLFHHPQDKIQKQIMSEANTVNPESSAALDALKPAQNFYTSALSGDPEALRALLGPEVSTVLGQYDQAAKTATALGPRGAGRNAVLAAAPFQKAAAYGTQLATARQGAAAGLGQVAGEEGQIAQGETSSRNQLLGSVLGSNAQQNALKAKAAGDLGSGFGSSLIDFFTNMKSGKTPPFVPQNNATAGAQFGD